MISAFILKDETVLCDQTTDGWLPVQVQLSTVATKGESSQAYQLGCVELIESLAPSHWAINSHNSEGCTVQDTKTKTDMSSGINHHINAPASIAITYDYAIKNNITLPIMTDSLLKSHAFISYRQLITQLPVALAAQLSQAIQLLRWQADTQFCSRCAAPVTAATLNERAMVCQFCKLRQYPRVQPCIITAITRPNPKTGEMQILLAHHHRYGQQKTASQALQYGLIAGFVEVGESLEHAVVREVAEEVGIQLSDIRYVSSQPWPFPSNLMLGFRASYAGGNLVIQEDELSHADFFDISNLPKIPFKGSIAYELIAQILYEQGLSL